MTLPKVRVSESLEESDVMLIAPRGNGEFSVALGNRQGVRYSRLFARYVSRAGSDETTPQVTQLKE